MSASLATDKQLTELSLGKPGAGREWYIVSNEKGLEAALVNLKTSETIYRKPIDYTPEPRPGAAPPAPATMVDMRPAPARPRTPVSTPLPNPDRPAGTAASPLTGIAPPPAARPTPMARPSVPAGRPLAPEPPAAAAPSPTMEGVAPPVVPPAPAAPPLQAPVARPALAGIQAGTASATQDATARPPGPSRAPAPTKTATPAPIQMGKRPVVPARGVKDLLGDQAEAPLAKSDMDDSGLSSFADLAPPIEGKPKDVERVPEAPAVKSMVEATQKAVGEFASPPDSIIVTQKSLKAESSAKGSYSLVIDPNQNVAYVLDEDGEEIRRFQVGTGDITGVQYGQKYYSPVGEFQIRDEVPYGQVEGSYGPLWMGLDAPKTASGQGYGLHGPHKAEDKNKGGRGFRNKGYVSHGCIRFFEDDMLEIGRLFDKGARVTVLPYAKQPPATGGVAVASTKARRAVESN